MAISRTKKENIVKTLTDSAKSAKSGVFVEYKGSTVSDLEGLRKELRKEGSGLRVAKKRLIKIALKESGYDLDNIPTMEGQVAVAFGIESEVSAPKVVNKYIKGKETFKILGGIMDGRFLETDQVAALAKLPTREQLLGQLVGTISAPISSFVCALNDVNGRFVRVLNAMAENKQ